MKTVQEKSLLSCPDAIALASSSVCKYVNSYEEGRAEEYLRASYILEPKAVIYLKHSFVLAFTKNDMNEIQKAAFDYLKEFEAKNKESLW